MSSYFAIAASALGFAWCAVHFFIGGREIAKPLRESAALPHNVIATAWMCWHMVTATLLLLAILPLLALWLGFPGMMISAALLASVIFASGIIAPLALGTTFKVLPQGWLFLPIAILTSLAV